MNILITGASGFIGSFLIEEALKEEMQVWAGVRSSSSRQYLQDERINFIDLPFENPDSLCQTLSLFAQQNGRWNYIIHNAGLTKSLNPADFNKVNFEYTRNFVQALQKTNLVPDKFILISSLSAERTPDTGYGKSKLQAERFLESTVGFPYIILRPTGVYGPRDKDYFLMLKTIQSGWNFATGHNPQKLTFIYVTDLVRAAFLALKCQYTGKIYIIADGEVYSDSEYTEMARKALGIKRVINIRVPLFILNLVCTISEIIGKVRKQPSTLNRDKYKILKMRDWTCDTSNIEQDINFKAKYLLREGLDECVKWYKTQGWLKP